MYFILTHIKGEWVLSQTDIKENAETWYHNQSTKLDGWGATEVILIKG